MERFSWEKLLRKFLPNPLQKLLAHYGKIALEGIANSAVPIFILLQKLCANMVLPFNGLQDFLLSLTVFSIGSRKFWGPLPLKLSTDTNRQLPLSSPNTVGARAVLARCLRVRKKRNAKDFASCIILKRVGNTFFTT